MKKKEFEKIQMSESDGQLQQNAWIWAKPSKNLFAIF